MRGLGSGSDRQGREKKRKFIVQNCFLHFLERRTNNYAVIDICIRNLFLWPMSSGSVAELNRGRIARREISGSHYKVENNNFLSSVFTTAILWRRRRLAGSARMFFT